MNDHMTSCDVLATSAERGSEPHPDEFCTASGWGSLSSSSL